MTKEQRTDVKVGVTVFVAISLLLFGILWAKSWHFGPSAQVVRAWFPTAGGVEAGAPVLVSGVKRGAVSAVDLKDSGVVVTMELVQPVELRRDASATITMLELMGGKKVELDPGFSHDALPPGAIVMGRNAGDIGSLVAMVTGLSSTLASITGKTDTLFASLNHVLEGDTLKESLSSTLNAARSTLAHIDAAAGDARAFLSKNGPELSHTLIAADSAMTSVSAIAGENRAGLRALVDSGGRAMFETRRSLSRLDSLLANASQQNTLLYRLTRDREFASRMDSVITSLLKLSEQIRLQGIDANVRFFNSAKPGP